MVTGNITKKETIRFESGKIICRYTIDGEAIDTEIGPVEPDVGDDGYIVGDKFVFATPLGFAYLNFSA